MEGSEIDVIDASEAYMAQVKGEVDIQIATAQRFPRKIEKFKADALSQATLDTETAEQCSYSLPRGGKDISGPSVRLAEIIVGCWRNIRAQSRVVGIDEKSVICQGACHDLETNTAISVEVKRRIVDKNGKRYNDDMIQVTANAGCAIAFRNAVFKVVPRAHWKHVWDAVRRVARGEEATLPQRRKAAIEFLEKKGVKRDRIFAKLEVKELAEINLDMLAQLRGMIQAVNDGDSTYAEMFGRKAPGVPLKKKKKSKGEAVKEEAANIDPAASISEKQVGRLVEVAGGSGWDDDTLNGWLKNYYSLEDPTEISNANFPEILAFLKEHGPDDEATPDF